MIYRAIALAIVCTFLFNDIAFGLSPVSRFVPIASSVWDEENDRYTITEDPAQKSHLTDDIKDDAAFLYLNILIGQFLHEMKALKAAGMSERGIDARIEDLKNVRLNRLIESITNDLPDINFDRYRYREILWDGDAIRLPYVGTEEDRRVILRYRMNEGGKTEFPDSVLIPIGNGLSVTLEARPEGEKDEPSGTPASSASPEGRRQLASGITDITGRYSELIPPKLLPKTAPFKLLYIKTETFESILAIYGDSKIADLVIGQGPLDYFESTDPADYQTHLVNDLPFAALLAETRDYIHKGVSYLDGAHAIIVARPGAQREDVLREWTTMLVDAGVIGRQYVMSTGRGTSSDDMDLMTRYALERSDRLELPPAADLSENAGGLPWEKWDIQGIGAAAAVLAVKDHPYVLQTIFNGKAPENLRTLIFGYGHVGSAFAKALFHDYSADVGVEIFAISNSEGILYAPDAALSRKLMRQINMNIRNNVSRPIWELPEASGIRRAGPSDTGDVYDMADCIVLASAPHTFRLKTAKGLRNKIVIEINPNVATPDARAYMNDPANGVFFVPYTTANIGKVYADREWLYNQMIGRAYYDTYAHIADGIAGLTIVNVWQVLSTRERLSYTDQYTATVEAAVRTLDEEFAEDTHYYLEHLPPVMEDSGVLDGLADAYRKLEMFRRQGLPDRIARKIAAFDQVYSDIIMSEGIAGLETELNSKTWQRRRVAAYKLGRRDYSPEDALHVVEVLGTRLLKERSRYVMVECMKAIGRMGRIEAVPYIVDALSSKSLGNVSPALWEWGRWSIERLRISAGDERVDRKLGEHLQEIKGSLVAARRAAKEKESQFTYGTLAELLYRAAVSCRFMDRTEDALTYYEEAAKRFVNAQLEGGLLPFAMELNLAELFMEMGRPDKAREALLRVIVPSEARRIHLGEVRDLDIAFKDVNSVASMCGFRKTALVELFILDGMSEDIARSLAAALTDYYNRRVVTSVPADSASLVQAEEAFCRDYDEKVADIAALYSIDPEYADYLRLLVLAGTELYYNFPRITENLMAVLSKETVSERIRSSLAKLPAPENDRIPPQEAGSTDMAATGNLRSTASETPQMKLDEAYTFLKGIDDNQDLAESYRLAAEIIKHPIDKALVVGNGLWKLPLLLALMGKEVVVVDANLLTVNTIEDRARQVARKLKDQRLASAIKLRVIFGEIGSLDSVKESLEPGSFGLVTFVDLVGPAETIKGDPRDWFLKAKEFLRPGGYIVVDEDNATVSITDILDEIFPAREALAGGTIFRGMYNRSRSRNILYRSDFAGLSDADIRKIESFISMAERMVSLVSPDEGALEETIGYLLFYFTNTLIAIDAGRDLSVSPSGNTVFKGAQQALTGAYKAYIIRYCVKAGATRAQAQALVSYIFRTGWVIGSFEYLSQAGAEVSARLDALMSEYKPRIGRLLEGVLMHVAADAAGRLGKKIDAKFDDRLRKIAGSFHPRTLTSQGTASREVMSRAEELYTEIDRLSDEHARLYPGKTAQTARVRAGQVKQELRQAADRAVEARRRRDVEAYLKRLRSVGAADLIGTSNVQERVEQLIAQVPAVQMAEAESRKAGKLAEALRARIPALEEEYAAWKKKHARKLKERQREYLEMRKELLRELKDRSEDIDLFDIVQYEEKRAQAVSAFTASLGQEDAAAQRAELDPFMAVVSAIDVQAAETVRIHRAEQDRFDRLPQGAFPGTIAIPYLAPGSTVDIDRCAITIHRNSSFDDYDPATWRNGYFFEVREDGVYKGKVFISVFTSADDRPVIDLQSLAADILKPDNGWHSAAVQWIWSQVHRSGDMFDICVNTMEDMKASSLLLDEPKLYFKQGDELTPLPDEVSAERVLAIEQGYFSPRSELPPMMARGKPKADSPDLSPDDDGLISTDMAGGGRPGNSRGRALPAFTEPTIQALELTGGDKGKTAERCGVTLMTIYYRIKTIRKTASKFGDWATIDRLDSALLRGPGEERDGGAVDHNKETADEHQAAEVDLSIKRAVEEAYARQEFVMPSTAEDRGALAVQQVELGIKNTSVQVTVKVSGASTELGQIRDFLAAIGSGRAAPLHESIEKIEAGPGEDEFTVSWDMAKAGDFFTFRGFLHMLGIYGQYEIINKRKGAVTLNQTPIRDKSSDEFEPIYDGDVIEIGQRIRFAVPGAPAAPLARKKGTRRDDEFIEEKNEAIDLKDAVIEKARSSEITGQKVIIALGTRCLPGYGKESTSPQNQDLNGLIISIRKFCESRGIPFIDQDDASLPSAIAAQRAQEGFQDARVVVLADIGAIEKELAAMQNDEKAFFVGVDNINLTPDSYVPIFEMLRIALELSADPSTQPRSRSLELRRSGKTWILVPYAAIKDYDELRRIYAIQKFA